MSMNRRLDGRGGEAVAEQYLTNKGFRCLYRNFSTRYGEIDLVMEDGANLVFVEVKRRRNFVHGSGDEAVGYEKQRRIVRSALVYLQRNGLHDRNVRFDVLVVEPEGIRHLESAFGSDGSFYP